MKCIGCEQEGVYPFRVLEVETLPVRGFKGEKKVQALREFHEYSVCGNCAKAYLHSATQPNKKKLRAMLLYGGIFALGVILLLFFWRSNGALRLLGLGSCFLGIVGMVYSQRTLKQKQASFLTLSQEDSMQRAAWERLLELAPKKRGDSDLTYIPVNSETLARKNGDLMILYRLLPEIAVEAYKRLHEGTSPEVSASEETGTIGI